MGVAKNKNNEPYIVQVVVNRASNEVMSVDVLYAINAKKEPAASLPKFTDESAPLTGSTISIADLLTYVNRYFPDVLPEGMLRHFGHRERPAGKLGEGALFSLKAYSEAEKKDHVKSAKEFFGKTYSWNETGYITTDGTKLDFSGRHDGAPGGQTGRRGDGRDRRGAVWAAISIHAPREGGDPMREGLLPDHLDFNPRPPRGGRLRADPAGNRQYGISIHAPREGGDLAVSVRIKQTDNFNPRPPRGGRPAMAITEAMEQAFQSTPPARGATQTRRPQDLVDGISIHAPREGGDH